VTTADYTPTTWARALLTRLGVPVSDSNVQAVTAWETAEGGHWSNPDRYNPLNTTQSEPGAVATNSAGVKAYTSWDQGLTATVQTLTNGMYAGILGALGQGKSADDVVSAVVKSPWGTKTISVNGVPADPGTGTGTTGTANATQTGLLGSVPTYLTKVALTVAFVAGGAVLVTLGLVKGTTPGRAYANHIKKGAQLAMAVA
jgi:hypothetical protein